MLYFDAYAVAVYSDGFYATRFQYNFRGCRMVRLKNRAFSSPGKVFAYLKKYVKHTARRNCEHRFSIVAPVVVVPELERAASINWCVMMTASEEAKRRPDLAWSLELAALDTQAKLVSEIKELRELLGVEPDVNEIIGVYSQQVKEIVMPIHTAALKAARKSEQLRLRVEHEQLIPMM